MRCSADCVHGLGESVSDIGAVTLLDGSSVSADSIDFNETTYHFTSGGSDITNQISRADKLRLVPGFDIDKENFRLHEEHPATGDTHESGGAYGTEPLNDSTLDIFAGQLATEPLKAPLEALDKGVSSIFGSSGVKTLATLAGIGIVVYLVMQSRK